MFIPLRSIAKPQTFFVLIVIPPIRMLRKVHISHIFIIVGLQSKRPFLIPMKKNPKNAVGRAVARSSGTGVKTVRETGDVVKIIRSPHYALF